MLEHFRGGVQGIEKSVNWCLCGFAVEASEVQMVPAAERALDLLDPRAVGRCEGLPVGVEIPSPGLTHRDAPHFKPHAYPGSSRNPAPGLTHSVSFPARPAAPSASSPSP